MEDTSHGGEGAVMELMTFLEAVETELLVSTSDFVYELLKNEQRRHLLLYLTEQETATPISRVATDLASRCNGTPVTNVTQAERERVHFRLEQEHLPRLADYGVISWTYGDEMVEPLPGRLSTARD